MMLINPLTRQVLNDRRKLAISRKRIKQLARQNPTVDMKRVFNQSILTNSLTGQVVNANPKGCNQYSGPECSDSVDDLPDPTSITEPSIPGMLYHYANRKSLDSIKKSGLTPGSDRGKNSGNLYALKDLDPSTYVETMGSDVDLDDKHAILRFASDPDRDEWEIDPEMSVRYDDDTDNYVFDPEAYPKAVRKKVSIPARGLELRTSKGWKRLVE